eukprot:142534-Prymnesium_polylepis.1
MGCGQVRSIKITIDPYPDNPTHVGSPVNAVPTRDCRASRCLGLLTPGPSFTFTHHTAHCAGATGRGNTLGCYVGSTQNQSGGKSLAGQRALSD